MRGGMKEHYTWVRIRGAQMNICKEIGQNSGKNVEVKQ